MKNNQKEIDAQRIKLVKDAIEGGEINPTWAEVSKLLEIPNTTARDLFKRNNLHPRDFSGDPEKSPVIPTSFIEHGKDGEIRYSKLMMMTLEDAKSPSRVLELCGFDPELWDIKLIRINEWNAQKANNEGQLIQHQVRLDLAQKNKSALTIADIDKFYKGFDHFPYAKLKPLTIKKGKRRVLEICVPDLHIGNGTTEIKERLIHAISVILAEANDVTEIVLVFLGDTMHFDTIGKTTTSGTQLFSPMTAYEMFDAAHDIIVSVISLLWNIAPVHVIGIYGNHDAFSSYALFSGVKKLYSSNSNIFVDTSHSLTKKLVIGSNLIILAHGDMPKKNLFDLPYNTYREDFGSSKQAEIHAGHVHHVVQEEKGGVIAKFMPTLTEPDEWHISKGYTGNLKALVAYLWEESGLRNTLQSEV